MHFCTYFHANFAVVFFCFDKAVLTEERGHTHWFWYLFFIPLAFCFEFASISVFSRLSKKFWKPKWRIHDNDFICPDSRQKLCVLLSKARVFYSMQNDIKRLKFDRHYYGIRRGLWISVCVLEFKNCCFIFRKLLLLWCLRLSGFCKITG